MNIMNKNLSMICQSCNTWFSEESLNLVEGGARYVCPNCGGTPVDANTVGLTTPWQDAQYSILESRVERLEGELAQARKEYAELGERLQNSDEAYQIDDEPVNVTLAQIKLSVAHLTQGCKIERARIEKSIREVISREDFELNDIQDTYHASDILKSEAEQILTHLRVLRL